MKKKFIYGLTSVFLGMSIFSISNEVNATTINSSEPTSGFIKDTGIQSRVLNLPQNVGGGTWTCGNPTGSSQAVSRYYHRSKKHSATVTHGNRWVKSIRGAGDTADASTTYKAGTNAYYWDNAPTGSIGNSAGGSF